MREIILEAKLTLFPDTQPFDQMSGTPELQHVVSKILAPVKLPLYPIGSSAAPRPGHTSNDYDVQIDLSGVANYFNVADAKSARQALGNFIREQGYQVKQTGITVHVRIPLKSGVYQADIEVIDHAQNISRLHRHNIPANSPYKGVNKQQLLSKLAKDRNLLYSAWQGLFNRNNDGSKGSFITNDANQIAKALLGSHATETDLGSVESILKKLPDAQQVLQQLQTDPNWKTVR